MKKTSVILLILIILFTAYSNTKGSYTKAIDANQSYIHISLDDVNLSVENLADNKYECLWDEPLFCRLKEYHETYGAVFSLYVFEDTFRQIGDGYQKDFFESADWLKIGLHSQSIDEIYDESTDYQTGKTDWNQFVDTVSYITGTTKSIDRFPRLHYFSGSKECLQGMKDANTGAVGFLAADDDRMSYYLSAEENSDIQINDSYYDDESELVFLKTDMRGDWFDDDFESENKYDSPKESGVSEELERRFSSEDYKNIIDTYIWFCHEWQIYDGVSLNGNIKWVEDVCRFARDKKIPFDYPQNQIERYISRK